MRASAFAIFILFAACGCQDVTPRTWRSGVEHYLADQANGDASALRDLPTPGSWKGFSIISENDPASATDVNGVLLAHRQIAGRNYFIYLVGLVRQQQVQDIRLALFSSSADGDEWHASRTNSQSLDAYRKFKEEQWRKLFPNRGDAPWSYSGFPGEGDVFKLDMAGNRVTATHEPSGAQWMVELPQDGPTTAPSVAGSN